MKLGPEDYQRINHRWDIMWKSVMDAQNMALNWIFTVNGVGLAGILTFAASRQVTRLVIAACVAFIIGIISQILFAMFYFYFESNNHEKFRKAVAKLYSGQMSYDEFRAREKGEVVYVYRTCEVLGWLAGISGVAGLIMTVFAVV